MKKKSFLFLLLFTLPFHVCSLEDSGKELTFVNKSHLDHLYQEIFVNGKTLGIIHIYSEFPDYKWVDASKEGITCIDDVARAVIFYKEYFEINNDKSIFPKIKNLTNFILYMQSADGWFYNFILPDYSINKTFKTSVAEPDWWSWRALWALSEVYPVIEKYDPVLGEEILLSLEKIVAAVKNNISLEGKTKKIDGFERPTWLPYENAADQASILVIGLVNYYLIAKDEVILKYIRHLCDGILMMQQGSEQAFPFGCFLSWQNMWHAYGNSQSYALLKASEILKNEKLKEAALNEIKYFYTYLVENKFLNEFELKRGNDTVLVEEKIFPQIAYNIRPMVYACIEAYEVTRDSSYAVEAGRIASWFMGYNPAGIEMYDIQSGRCFDGINSGEDINKNSGAESTIEALLSLAAIENNEIAFDELKRFLNEK